MKKLLKYIVIATLSIGCLDSCEHKKDNPQPTYPLSARVNGIDFNGLNCQAIIAGTTTYPNRYITGWLDSASNTTFPYIYIYILE